MNGPAHFAEAERLLDDIAVASANGLHGLTGEFAAVPSWASTYLAAAQVHATLALTAVTALSSAICDPDDPTPAGLGQLAYDEWHGVAG